jgi:hypothetical protein
MIRWYLDKPHAVIFPSYLLPPNLCVLESRPIKRSHDVDNLLVPSIHLPVQNHELHNEGADLYHQATQYTLSSSSPSK